jgi:hypothetical protein
LVRAVLCTGVDRYGSFYTEHPGLIGSFLH